MAELFYDKQADLERLKGKKIAIVGFGCVFGLLLGGLLALRPDHVLLISNLRKALNAGSWAVVVHPVGATQVQAALDYFASTDTRVLRSA